MGAAAPTATELVTRPEPGLARGKWEAPAWLFWVMLFVVIVGPLVYVLRRAGMLNLKRTRPPETPPPSRGKRP
jgi:hypothetical protein